MTGAHAALRPATVRTMPAPSQLHRWLIRAVAIPIGVAVLGAALLLTVLPLVTHGAARTVLSGSMSPALPVGSVVFDRPVDPATLRVGDIATYREKLPGGSVSVTHRIAAIDTATTPTMFTFRGDANRAADPVAVPASAIQGKVWFDVPYLGAARSRVADLRSLLVLLGVIGLGGFAVWQIAGGLREWRSSR